MRTLRRFVISIHRWMGVALCGLFLTWFLSGMVLMYCPFPEVSAADRLAHAAPLDAARVQITPEEAQVSLAEAGTPARVRMNLLDGRPVYRFESGPVSRLVFADDGRRLDAISQEMALRIASSWSGLSQSAAAQTLVTRPDQWTVGFSGPHFGSYWKFGWPNGREVYVSRSSGEVVQDTTRMARIEAYCGAIPHWLYFAFLRRNPAVWSRIVIGLSCLALVASILGLVIGIWLYSPSRRYRSSARASHIPYTGIKRWHMILGLAFGTFTTTWVFSGLLSMGPFSWLSDAERLNLGNALGGGGIDLTFFAAKTPSQAIAEASPELKVKELEFGSFDGGAFYLASDVPGRTRIVTMDRGPRQSFDTTTIIHAVQRAVAPTPIAETRQITNYEPYYVDRLKRLPLPVLYVRLSNPVKAAFYIDARTGTIVQGYGVRSRWNRWLYHGLHSMDFPWLYAHRPLWDIAMIGLALGGTILVTTSVLLAAQLVRRKMRLG